MKISKKSWIYQKTYWFRDVQPKAVSPLRFCWDIFLALLAGFAYWLIVGTICFLFAWKLKKSENNFFADIEKWPKILGHRIWPLSLIGLGFMIWPFVDFNSWKSREIFILLTLTSLCFYVPIIFTSETWKEISERAKIIVFTENGKA